MQEGVEEVDGEEAQVSQPLEQSLYAGIADLGDLAGVERLAEANVNIIFMETHIGSDKYTRTHIHTHTQPSMGDCCAAKQEKGYERCSTKHPSNIEKIITKKSTKSKERSFKVD